jgi:hypothetical protein
VLFSAASIWEIAINAGLRRADFVVDPRAIVARRWICRVGPAFERCRNRRRTASFAS